MDVEQPLLDQKPVQASQRLYDQIVIPEGGDADGEDDGQIEKMGAEDRFFPHEIPDEEWVRLEKAADVGYQKFAQFIRATGGTEPIPREIYPHVEVIARAWQAAHDQYLYVYHHPNEIQYWSWAEELWDDRAEKTGSYMRPILDTGDILKYLQPLAIDLAGEGNEHISELIRSMDFGEKAALVEFVTYDLWLQSRRRTYSSTGPAGELSLGHQMMLKKYEQARQVDLPIIAEGLVVLSHQGDLASVRGVLEHLEHTGEQQCAQDVLSDSRLTLAERKAFMIQHINVFGFIHTVDTIAHQLRSIEALDRQEVEVQRVYSELKSLFSLIQGAEVDTVLSELSEVYQAVDFDKYPLNEARITERDIAYIEAVARSYAVEHGLDPHDVSIFDIGAGTGRHLRRLHEAGYTHLIGLEQEHKHAEYIRDHVPGAEVIEASWDRIPLPDGGFLGDSESAPEVFYCLGRTLLHNRTPSDMLKFFDELQRVTHPEAIGLVDIPDVDIGVYEERVRSFSNNLSSLGGIDPHEARFVFDGPDAVHRFNRMTLTSEQLNTYARLCGFKVAQLNSESIGEGGEVRNLYFQLVKDQDFFPGDFTRAELSEFLKIVGLYDSGVDYGIYIDAWGMTLGQALLYGLDNDDVRRRNEQGEPPNVMVEKRGRTLYFEGAMRV